MQHSCSRRVSISCSTRHKLLKSGVLGWPKKSNHEYEEYLAYMYLKCLISELQNKTISISILSALVNATDGWLTCMLYLWNILTVLSFDCPMIDYTLISFFECVVYSCNFLAVIFVQAPLPSGHFIFYVNSSNNMIHLKSKVKSSLHVNVRFFMLLAYSWKSSIVLFCKKALPPMFKLVCGFLKIKPYHCCCDWKTLHTIGRSFHWH